MNAKRDERKATKLMESCSYLASEKQRAGALMMRGSDDGNNNDNNAYIETHIFDKRQKKIKTKFIERKK